MDKGPRHIFIGQELFGGTFMTSLKEIFLKKAKFFPLCCAKVHNFRRRPSPLSCKRGEKSQQEKSMTNNGFQI